MASFQRVALFILFDAMERDLVARLRSLQLDGETTLLIDEERDRARARLQRRESPFAATAQDEDLLFALDLGDKYKVLMRHKSFQDQASAAYYSGISNTLEKAIPVRNSTMHGRPLTTTEYATGFAIANDLIKTPSYWPLLHDSLIQFESDPKSFVATAIDLLETDPPTETLHNLPEPDYDDTGFLPRPELERELRKKLLSRNPVVTVLGDGGNGKTALTLQVLYGMVASNDHPFDAIVWVSAKSSRLGTHEIERIEGSITNSLGIFEQIADTFEPGVDSPLDRVRRLLEENTILLVIDNLETVLDETIQNFSSDIPGQSKLLFTSRVPLGSDLTVLVGEFDAKESKAYLYRLIEAHGAERLRKLKSELIDRHITRLGRKPLLLKWFVLGVVAGLDPDSITANPKAALQFCMENVVGQLHDNARELGAVLATLPSGVSQGVLHHITDMPAPAIEAGIAELLRFSLIERDHKFADERVYVLKPFVRAYIARVLKRAPVQVEAVLARYRSIEGAFQAERGRFSKYDIRSYAVRSKTEAIACRRLRHAASLILNDSFEEAESIISELRITTPEYFEIYRVEAFLAEREGDMSRAQSCYETGLEFGSDQDQMHLRYALFLTRAFNDHNLAYKHLQEAQRLDPKSSFILRELARNRFFVYEFDTAQKYISECLELESLTAKDKIILADLQAQRYARAADIATQRGKFLEAAGIMDQLTKFLCDIDDALVDETFIEHLRKALPTIDILCRAPETASRHADMFDLRYLIDQFTAESADMSPPDRNSAICTGALKLQGLKERFGFIRDSKGRETYVARDSVPTQVWSDMLAGRTVQFQIARNRWGATYATNLSVI